MAAAAGGIAHTAAKSWQIEKNLLLLQAALGTDWVLILRAFFYSSLSDNGSRTCSCERTGVACPGSAVCGCRKRVGQTIQTTRTCGLAKAVFCYAAPVAAPTPERAILWQNETVSNWQVLIYSCGVCGDENLTVMSGMQHCPS